MTQPPSTVIKNPTWWRRRTQLERVLIVLITTISALCVVLVVALALTSYKQAVNILPVEVIDEIWCQLPFADILSCLSVSRSWYESISDCAQLWRPLCIATNLTNLSWKSIFMREAKLRWSWRKGLFPESNVINLIHGYKIINCSEDYIYVVDENNKLWKYGHTAVNLASIQLDNNCVHMCAIEDLIVIMLNTNTAWNELVFLNELFEELARFRTRKDNKIHKFGDRLWTWEYRDNSMDIMSVFSVKSLEQIEHVNIPFGAKVLSLEPGWCILNRGEVWWLNGNSQTKLYASCISPMARPCIDILTNNKDKIVILDTKHIQTLPTMSALDAEKNDSESFSLQQLGKTAEDDICFSEECVHTASYLLDAMDLTAEPCDDFYQFACGKFRQQTVPDDKESLSVFTSVDELVKKQLKKIVSEPIMPDEPRHLINPKNLYKICMDKETIEERGLQDAQEIIDFFGGWPVVEGDKWDMGSFDWKEITYKFRIRGFSVDYLLDFSVTVDSKNSTTRIIELDAGALALSRKYLMRGLEDRIVAAYYTYMVDLAVLLGAEKEKAEAELKESLDFEIQLANVSLPSEERRDYEKLYNKMTLTELQQKFPTIPWMEYFSRLLGPYILIDEDEPVIVIEPQYISALEQILQHTPKRIQANYLMWRVVSAIANYMPERFRQRTLKFHTAITGSTEQQPRWKQCVGIASGSVTYAVGSLYIKKFFKHESKKNALELVDRIRTEMYKTLQRVDWMDEDTRKNALEKAKSIKEFIAYPDELLDDNKLAEFYQNYDVSNVTSFLEAILRTAEFATNFMMSRLRQPVNKTEWLIHASPAVVVNALYNDDENFDFYWGAIGQLSSKNRRLAGIDPLWAVPRKYDVTNVTSYLDAVLRTTKFATNYTLSRLRQPVNKTEWLRHASPAVVNAFYNGLENSIDFPAGILQGIFFNSDRPSYMNYGGIGFVIGHEITHGFDDQGRQFDKDGNLKEWWAAETKAKYLQKAQCIIYQYGNYTDKQVDMKLNGINTQGENIADNGGLKQAYRAYLNWIKDNDEEKRLPGLQKYSPRQMFWIAAASTWCTVYRNESLSNRITTGSHSPGEFRVRGPFSNSEDFARDFDCPRGSVMNPIHKCAVW